ncbi:hypothetical protein [Zymomonas sp.]|nr:hypothetical protein [Zymomonas sp.]MCA1956841.1 hypothetical protein [Zymomonas sp.]
MVRFWRIGYRAVKLATGIRAGVTVDAVDIPVMMTGRIYESQITDVEV